MSLESRPLPETPVDAVRDRIRERVFVGEHTFVIERPASADDLFDHPAIRAAFAADDYQPFWADLWPAARMLAKVVLAERWSSGLTALEVGCGLGSPGIAALSRGLRVIFSDYDRTAVKYAANNARINNLTNFVEMPFDWRNPPENLTVDIVLTSDLTYEARHVEPLLSLVQRVLVPGGMCLWTDQNRQPAAILRADLERLGWPLETSIVRAGKPGGERFKGTLYRLRRPTVDDSFTAGMRHF